MPDFRIPDTHVTDLLAAYALDALDAAEARQVAAHLEACPECTAELRSYQPVVDELALGTPHVQPPPALKDRLIERVRPLPQMARPAPAPAQWDWLVALRRTLRLRWQVVALVVILALAASNVLLWQRVETLNRRAGPQFHTITLASTDAARGASGLLVISANGTEGTLIVDHLPVLDETQVYQLWLIDDGQRTSGGIFSVSPAGYATLEIEAPDGPLIDYSSFGITIEPAGGSPGPTGDKVLGGDL